LVAIDTDDRMLMIYTRILEEKQSTLRTFFLSIHKKNESETGKDEFI